MRQTTTVQWRPARGAAAPAIFALLLAAAALFAPAGAVAFDLPDGLEWTTNLDDPPIGDPDAKKGGTFNASMDSYPLTFRLMGPESNDAFASWNRAYTMDFALVIRHPATDNFIPWMASHWAIHKDSDGDGVEDNRVVYYKLREDATWSDGHPVTADDYVFTWEMMRSAEIRDPWYNNYAKTWFRSVEALDTYVLKIEGTVDSWKPLAQFVTWPTPRHATDLADRPGSNWVDRVVYDPQVVAGPYVIDPAQNIEGQQVVFTRIKGWWGENDHYMKGMFNPDRVVVKVFPNERNLDFFTKREIDYYTENTSRKWAEQTAVIEPIKKGWAHRRLVYTETPAGVYGIHLNLSFPLFENKDFRKGLQYMFDFDKINEQMMYKAYRRQVSAFEGTEYENKGLKAYGFNPREADAAFKRAGFEKRGSDGIRVNAKGERAAFTLTYGSKGLEPHLTVYQSDLKRMGVDMSLKLLESAAAFALSQQRKYEALVGNRTAGYYPDPEQYFHSKFAYDKDGNPVLDNNNLWGFGRPDTDKLIETFMYNMDKEARLKAMDELDSILQDEAFYIPFWDAPYIRVLYWDNVRWPEFVLPKRAEQVTDYQVFWIDLERQARLEKAIANGEDLGEDPVTEVDYYKVK